MKRLTMAIALIAGLVTAGAANAAPRTVALDVKGMTCASCPYIVQKALADVPGVSKVEVSLEKKMALVTFDDDFAKVEDLTKASTNAGYPASLSETAMNLGAPMGEAGKAAKPTARGSH